MDWVQANGIAQDPNLWIRPRPRFSLHALWTVKVLTTELILDKFRVAARSAVLRSLQLLASSYDRRILTAASIHPARPSGLGGSPRTRISSLISRRCYYRESWTLFTCQGYNVTDLQAGQYLRH